MIVTVGATPSPRLLARDILALNRLSTQNFATQLNQASRLSESLATVTVTYLAE